MTRDARDAAAVTPGPPALRAEQVSALFRFVAPGVLAAAVAAAMLSALLVFLGGLGVRTAILWPAYIAVCASAHLLLRHVRRQSANPDARWRAWGAAFTAIAAAEGLGWAWAEVGLVGYHHFGVEMMVVVVCFAVATGAITAFGSYLPAFAAIFLPISLTYPIWSLSAPDRLQRASDLMMLVFVPAIGLLGLLSHRTFNQLVGLRLRSEALADDLRRETRLAEAANRAKSAFLSATSHDLRQPVHALGLFVGALTRLELPAEGRRLVSHIEASVAAMDGLFTALLDISRLDAGLVTVQPRAFDLRALLERLAAEYGEEAHAKGLRFHLAPGGGVVHTDPVLLERVLRNLIANAVRHTSQGAVLVGYRRGPRPRVEVWDTGPGIGPEDQSRVFEEYVQLANPERDRAKGLGLGLAIVRRLALLLGSAVDLRSRAGRGCCFSIAIASASTADPSPPASDETLSALSGGLVAIIDDEGAILDAMSAILSAWGYGVVVGGCGEEIVERLARSPSPDLIICDLRLRGEETGIAVIERLRSLHGRGTPAILMSGDTAPERLLQAEAAGLTILHKPIRPGRLRAAIGNLIRQTGAIIPGQPPRE